MTEYKKSLRIPVLISLPVSLCVLIMMWYLKDSPVKEYVLTVTLQASLAIFILFLIYFFVAQIFMLFQKSIWLSGIPIALLIYFGILIVSLSYFKGLVDKMDWDVSMVGLGIAVITIGISLLPRHELPQTEETLKELKAHSDDLGDKVAAFSKTQSNLENVMSLVSKESQNFLKSLTKQLEQSGQKDD